MHRISLSDSFVKLMRLTGVEPVHMASEANAISISLQAHKFSNLLYIKLFDSRNKIYLKRGSAVVQPEA